MCLSNHNQLPTLGLGPPTPHMAQGPVCILALHLPPWTFPVPSPDFQEPQFLPAYQDCPGHLPHAVSIAGEATGLAIM